MTVLAVYATIFADFHFKSKGRANPGLIYLPLSTLFLQARPTPLFSIKIKNQSTLVTFIASCSFFCKKAGG